MYKKFFILRTMIAIAICLATATMVLGFDKPATHPPQSENAVEESLDFLTKLNGKYPYEVKLLDNPILKKRLKRMLGSQYNFMKSIWQVEIPITVKDGFFYVWAMQAHSGGDPSADLMADIENNVLYVIIKKDGHKKLYSEDGSNLPEPLQEWADKQ